MDTKEKDSLLKLAEIECNIINNTNEEINHECICDKMFKYVKEDGYILHDAYYETACTKRTPEQSLLVQQKR